MEEQWSIFYPKFIIKDDIGKPVMRIDRPFCCGEDFTVTSATDGSEVGSIIKIVSSSLSVLGW